SGWRLDEFDPKPLEPQPAWDYETRAVELIRAANSVLDMGTGGGELFDALTASFFGRTVATEPWSVNAPIAAARLRPRGIAVVRCGSLQLPFRLASFDLVLNRHEELDPAEVARVITFDGSVLTQQVGSSRWRELRPFFPRMQDFGDLFHRYEHGLQTSGLTIIQARTHDWKAAYRTLGDIVFLLCIAPWEIPHFDPLDADLPALLAAEESLSTEQGILLTDLPLKGYRKMLTLMRRSRAVSYPLAKTPGLIGFTFRAKLFRRRFWTLSAWEDEKALMEFVGKVPHLDTMKVLGPHMGDAF